jgi:Phosphotyrosyl phosphate activator (PTPA) protein
LFQKAEGELKKILPENKHSAAAEVGPYLVEAFGNDTRIDYGTGHEMSFLFFLCCLFKIGAFESTDKTAVVTKVFKRFAIITLVRCNKFTWCLSVIGTLKFLGSCKERTEWSQQEAMACGVWTTTNLCHLYGGVPSSWVRRI